MRNIPVEHLVDVARSSRREDRSALAEAIGELCLKTGRDLSNKEKSLAYDIISALIRDVETQVRAALSNRLADQRDAPHDLIVRLANDVIEVARPVIVRSVVLQDDDLINMIINKAESHQIAIAEREVIPPKVTETLVRTENSSVIAAALSNHGAQFSERTMEDVVNLSKEDEALQAPLVQRRDLSAAQARKMYEFVGFTMRKALEEKITASGEAFDLDMESVVDQAVAEALEQDDFYSPLEQPDGFGSGGGLGFKPHPRLLVGALEQNDLFRFEELFQEVTDLTEQGATRVLYDSGPEAIAIACKAVGFDRKNFGDLLAYLQGGGEPEKYRQTSAYIKIMDYFERIDRTGADRVLSAWRRAPDDSWTR
ncbi:DUF2336 domain-containing protein [Pacificispira sp.]|uniref:DUF2336 domain-containing protein n=1 Tax=Pacificispira sp. TaxID=2888761 RepID=UPI003B51F551